MSKKAKQISTYVVIALGASVVLGGIFTVMFMQTFSKANVIVAAKDITPYSGTITNEHFTTIEVAKGDLKNFTGFVSNINDLVGKVATTAIYKGQPVKDVQFVSPKDAVGLQSIVTSEGKSVGTKRFSFVKVRQGQTMSPCRALIFSAFRARFIQ